MLYAELIQHLPKRSLAWLRPLALKVDESCVPDKLIDQGDRLPDSTARVFDVRNTADLIWPIHRFRMGLDTEVIDVMAVLPDLHLAHLSADPNRDTYRRILNEFLRTAWQATQDDLPTQSMKP